MRQALALHQAHRRQEAESLYRQVLGRVDHPAAAHFLGLLLHQTGRTAEGLPLLARSLKAAPDNPDFLNNYGTVLREMGRFGPAAEQFRRAVTLKPDHLPARDNLAALDRQLGRFEAAEEVFRGTILRSPFHMRARLGLAEALQETGRTVEAVRVYREALVIRPQDPELLNALGVALMETGDLAEAGEMARQALTIAPDLAKAWLLLSQVKPQKEPDDELRRMVEHHARAPEGSVARMQLAFGLGKAQDDLGEYGRAFDYFAEANAIRRKDIVYDGGKTRRDIEAMKAIFTGEFFKSRRTSGLSDETPIFVVGMPRSGTTLVEQIIASHPQVYGAGELDILKAAIAKGFPPDMKGGFPGGVAAMPDKAFAEAGRWYLDMLRRRYPDARHVTDKMPGNFVLIGFIHMMLPAAKIVHCTRGAAATCLSIFKSHFREGHLYGYDLIELADFHNLYTEMMAHWHAMLPGVVHDVRYEDFVADQEGQSRALIEWLGLPWDDAVLDFHKAARPVRTASAAQVRQPIYKGSVDLWKRYGDRLDPLLSRLKQV